MKGMLAPKFREVELGQAEVRSVYKISSVGTIAGCYVKSGKVARNAKIRLVRDGMVLTEDEITSLRRFKDDVKEVQQNFECGMRDLKTRILKREIFLISPSSKNIVKNNINNITRRRNCRFV